jgi:acyl-CoA synthetase (AMP-forming)/AMP-acid ligase II
MCIAQIFGGLLKRHILSPFVLPLMPRNALQTAMKRPKLLLKTAVSWIIQGRNVFFEAANTAILELVQSGEVSRYAPLDRPHAVEALPRTSVGKIEKKLIRTQPATLTTQGGA